MNEQPQQGQRARRWTLRYTGFGTVRIVGGDDDLSQGELEIVPVEDLLSDAAVRRAAVAMEDAAVRLLGRDLGTAHRDNIARLALHAALGDEEDWHG